VKGDKRRRKMSQYKCVPPALRLAALAALSVTVSHLLPSSPAIATVFATAQREPRSLSEKLYPRGTPRPAAFCDIHTSLIVDRSPLAGTFAILEDKVTGFCRIWVKPNVRFLRLAYIGSECGSTIFEGANLAPGDVSTVRIQDNEGRFCRDMRPKLEVTEMYVDGTDRVLVGLDGL
jgi:hypothetical protein